MTKLYLLGGESIVKRNAKDINATAFQDAGGAPSVLVIPWARASFDKTYKRRKRLFDYFRNLGASNIDFADYSETPEEIALKIQTSDLIYLTGGLTTVLLERLKNKGVDTMLRTCNNVIVGRSAGALALCKHGILINKDTQETKLVAGLRLVESTVRVHYKLSEDPTLRKLSERVKIYAIPERSAIIHDNGALSFMGNIHVFQNGEKTAAKH
ncbi:MAG: Type 1 glutamine amidotransferase-like domain-containing protein [Candidatus Bathyarchaeota archaeon]|nr:Type 1 glutamine amidotransferase-like domain-containing protein [Candidatus Bathyarchaeota archaeon]